MPHLTGFYFGMLCYEACPKKILCFEWMKAKVAVVVSISGAVVTAMRMNLTTLTSPQFVFTNH